VTRKKILLANFEVRRQQLESFGRAPTLLSAALRQFPKKKAWLYKPSADRWSIHEIILHLADSEVSAYVHCRHFVAEPESSVLKFDPARWAGSLGYSHQSSHDALEIIRCLRKATYQLLVLLPEPAWEYSVKHPEDRRLRLSLAQWIEIQERHIPHHIDQMKQNYNTWLKMYPQDLLLVKNCPSRGGRAAVSR
jgi:DinB superfamily